MTEQSKILACIETLKTLVDDNQKQHNSYFSQYRDTDNTGAREMGNYHLGKTQAYQNALDMLQAMVEG